MRKGMQGWICYPECANGYWLADFPQCGAKGDIAMIGIKEEDLRVIPIMYAIVNEHIKAEFDALEQQGKAGEAQSPAD